MAQCDLLSETLPELLAESLEGEQRERAYRHIETCDGCSREWAEYRRIWGDLEWNEIEPPAGLRERFLSQVAEMGRESSENVVRFPGFTIPVWAKTAAVILLLIGGFAAGRSTVETDDAPDGQSPALITGVQPVGTFGDDVIPPAELDRMLRNDATLRNVSLVEAGDDTAMAFDLSTEMRVPADLSDPSFSRLMAIALSNTDHASHERGKMIEWIRRNHASSETSGDIVAALLGVLRSDSHEGVRIRALDALRELEMSPNQSDELRTGLVQVLRNDPNPAIRIKAVDVLAEMASGTEIADPTMLETLRDKVEQDDENMYVRVKAAEALRQMKF